MEVYYNLLENSVKPVYEDHSGAQPMWSLQMDGSFNNMEAKPWGSIQSVVLISRWPL